MEARRVQLCKQQKLRDLEIAHQCRAILRLQTDAVQSHCVNLVHNLEIGTQLLDSENVQHNLLDCVEQIYHDICVMVL